MPQPDQQTVWVGLSREEIGTLIETAPIGAIPPGNHFASKVRAVTGKLRAALEQPVDEDQQDLVRGLRQIARSCFKEGSPGRRYVTEAADALSLPAPDSRSDYERAAHERDYGSPAPDQSSELREAIQDEIDAIRLQAELKRQDGPNLRRKRERQVSAGAVGAAFAIADRFQAVLDPALQPNQDQGEAKS